MGKKTKKEILQILKENAVIFNENKGMDTYDKQLKYWVSRDIFDNIIRDVIKGSSKENQIIFFTRYAQLINKYSIFDEIIKKENKSLFFYFSDIDKKEMEKFQKDNANLNSFEMYTKLLTFFSENEKYKKLFDRFSIDMRADLIKRNNDDINKDVIKILEEMNLPDSSFENVKYSNVLTEEPSAYEKVADDKIKALLKIELKKEKPNQEYIKMLNESNEFLTSVERDTALVGSLVEHCGEFMSNQHKAGIAKFLEQNNLDNVLTNKDLSNSAVAIEDFYKKNKFGEYKLGDKFKKTLVDMIKILREHNMKGETLSLEIREDSKNLLKAIKENNSEDIIKYHKIVKEKTDTIDYIIPKLKELDPSHFFNSNFASSREEYYPGRYRIDFEGNTLYNQIAKINTLCLQYNIEPEEFINNPMPHVNKVLKEYNDNALTMYKELFDNDDIFSFVNNVKKFDKSKFSFIAASVNKDFIQLPNCLSINNFENRDETSNYLHVELSLGMQSVIVNVNKFADALVSKNFDERVLPGKILLGKDYDPIKMFEDNDGGLLDVQTKEFEEKIRLKDYIENECDLNELLDNLTNAKNQIDQKIKDGSIGKYKNKLENGIVNSAKILKEVYQNKALDKETVGDYIDVKAGILKVNSIKENTLKTKFDLEVYDLSKLTSDNFNEKFNLLAELNKKYYSHNGLSRVFNSSLRDQKRLIDGIKKDFIDSGVNKKDLNNALKSFRSDTHQDRERVNTFITDNCVVLNEKELYQESVTRLDLSNAFVDKKLNVEINGVQEKDNQLVEENIKEKTN